MKIMMTNVRIGFAHGLFKSSAFEEGQTPKYGADFIETKETVVYEVRGSGETKQRVKTTMKDAMLAVANEAWKGRGADMLADFESSKKCYRNGDKRLNKDGEVYEGYEGTWYVTAKTPVRPTLFDRQRGSVTEEDGLIYSGCYGNVTFDLYPNTKPKFRGVFAALTGVQFVKDGDAFGGGGGVARPDDFDDLGEGADSGDDLT